MPTAEYRLADDLRRHRWLWIGLALAAGVWCWVDVMPRGEINPRRLFEHRTDFTVYTEAGQAFFDGRDPYSVTNARGWHYLYPPLFAILVSPLHTLPSNWQVAVWFALSALMAAGCYVELRRLLVVFAPDRVADDRKSGRLILIVVAGLLAALLPALNCLQRGQVEVFKLYLLLLGFRLFVSSHRRREEWLAGIVLAMSIVLKLTPLLPVACLLLHECVVVWRQRVQWNGWMRPFSLGVGLVSGLLLFSLFVPAALLGWNANLRHLEKWYRVAVTKAIDVRQTGFGEHVRSMRNQSLDNAAYRFGNWLIRQTVDGPDDTLIDDPIHPRQKLPMDSVPAGRLILVGRLAALVALLLVVLRVAASGQPIGSATSFGLACVATLVVGPVARGSYFLLVLPAVVFVSIWLDQLGKPRTALATAFFPAGLIWLYYLFLPVSGRTGLLGLGMAAWFFAVCALLERLLARKRSAWHDADRRHQSAISGPDSSLAAAA